MVRKIRSIYKKIVILIMIYSMLSIYLPRILLISFALDNTNISSIEENNILKLSTPTNVKLSENYICSWTKVDHVDYYRVDYKIITSSGIEKTGFADYINGWDITETAGVEIANLTEAINYAYRDALCHSPEEVQISFRIRAIAPYQTDYIDSEFSEYSNSIIYPTRIQLNTPANVKIEENFYATWNIENFTFADQISKFELDYKITYGDSEKTGYTNFISRYYCSYPEDNKVRVHVKDVLNQAYTEAGYTREKVQISFRVRAISNNDDMYKESEYSEYSNVISFAYDGKNPLDTPTNVIFTEDFKGSWTKVDNADFYSIEYKIEYNGSEKIIASDAIEQFDLTENNGILTTNLESNFKKAYTAAGYMGEKVQISYRIAASVRYYDYTLKYGDSPYSEYSNKIYYKPDLDTPNFRISGKINSYNSNTDNISIKLYKEGISDVFVEINTKGNNINYTIQDLLPGNYKIKFIKNNHITKEYSITVDNADVIQDVTIYLLGDINGDGDINARDAKLAIQYFTGKVILEEDQIERADVFQDRTVNARDAKLIIQYFTGKITSF